MKVELNSSGILLTPDSIDELATMISAMKCFRDRTFRVVENSTQNVDSKKIEINFMFLAEELPWFQK